MKKKYDNAPAMMKDFFGQRKWKGSYVHMSLTMKFDQTRMTKITLTTSGTHQRWTGFIVSIVHKQNGEIGRQFFPFKDYLKPDPKTINGIKEVNHLWPVHNGGGAIEWYGPTPTNDSVVDMIEAIQAWIADWQVL